ncbi:unnamed protein product [Adineta steineri]|uniref:Phytanoyl-CoA dioxygenase n=1 Tax=Adineta steineri TaxID=433720 RepID=A0A813MEQ7_9BILA|nr:unnamed protein product [Adineta steineri]CAF0891145.1 unnamed protein product [Adineta steineri]
MGNTESNSLLKPLDIHLSPGNDEIFQPAPLPLDSDGFIISFNVEQQEEILTFFEKHGVVVVSNVLTDEQCQRSVDEVWLFLQEMYNQNIDRNKPETWSFGWPSFSKMGIVGNERWLYPQACDNRQNPNIYQVFRTLLGENELIVNITRAGLMRPTKNIFFSSLNKTEDREEWKTISEWLHLDMNPLTGRATTYGFEHVGEGHFDSSKNPDAAINNPVNNGMRIRKLQGILALADCREEDGGFHAVPGFQHFIETWTKQNKQICIDANESGDPTTVQIPQDDPIRQYIQRMPIRKGSLLVWDSRLPHGNFPNNSSSMRIVQYLHMAPVNDEAIRSFPLSKDDLPSTFHLTDLGKKLYGFKSWESNIAKKRFREERNPQVLERVQYERNARNVIKTAGLTSQK